MKLIDLVNIKTVFKPEMKFQNIQVGYKAIKFLKSIEQDISFYYSKLSEIAQDCAVKDGNKIKTDNGMIVLSTDKIKEWDDKTLELANIEVDIDLPSFQIDDFSGCDLSIRELQFLEPLITE